MDLSERIIRYRAKHRITQKEMAQRCGITPQTLCYIETGQQTPGKMTQTKIELVLETDDGDKHIEN